MNQVMRAGLLYVNLVVFIINAELPNLDQEANIEIGIDGKKLPSRNSDKTWPSEESFIVILENIFSKISSHYPVQELINYKSINKNLKETNLDTNQKNSKANTLGKFTAKEYYLLGRESKNNYQRFHRMYFEAILKQIENIPNNTMLYKMFHTECVKTPTLGSQQLQFTQNQKNSFHKHFTSHPKIITTIVTKKHQITATHNAKEMVIRGLVKDVKEISNSAEENGMVSKGKTQISDYVGSLGNHSIPIFKTNIPLYTDTRSLFYVISDIKITQENVQNSRSQTMDTPGRTVTRYSSAPCCFKVYYTPKQIPWKSNIPASYAYPSIYLQPPILVNEDYPL